LIPVRGDHQRRWLLQLVCLSFLLLNLFLNSRMYRRDMHCISRRLHRHHRLQPPPQNIATTTITSGQSNSTKRLHRLHIGTVRSYPPGGANVHCHLTHASLRSPKFIPQTASQSVQPFLHSSWRKVPIFYNKLSLSPQNCPFAWGTWTPPIHGSWVQT